MSCLFVKLFWIYKDKGFRFCCNIFFDFKRWSNLLSFLKSNYHKNKILQFPKKWKNVDFLIKLEPIKIRQEKRISPTVNWCKNAGSLCRWVFCPGRYTFVGDKSKSLNWKIRLKSFASSILEDFACYLLLLSHFQEPIEWWNEQSDIDSFLI